MKVFFLIGLGIFSLHHNVMAQESDVCTISAIVVPLGVREADLEKFKPTELGRVDISRVTEGTTFPNTFRIVGTKLYAYVEIFFDDDMKFYDGLHDALTVSIVLSTSRERTTKSVIALSSTSVALDENFKQVDVLGTAKTAKHKVGINVSCRGNKPKAK